MTNTVRGPIAPTADSATILRPVGIDGVAVTGGFWADDRIDAVRGSVAIEVGPLVYAVEQVDLPDGVSVDDLHIDPDAPLRLGDLHAGLAVHPLLVSGHVHRHEPVADPYSTAAAAERGEPVAITAIPYFAWANRGPDAMRVWIPADWRRA